MQADLVKVIANACSNCRVAQDIVRSVEGGIPLILSHCNSDHTSPFLREWAILAVRNICAGNLENQVYGCTSPLTHAYCVCRLVSFAVRYTTHAYFITLTMLCMSQSGGDRELRSAEASS